MSPKANRCLTVLVQNEGGYKPRERGDPETYRGISREAFPSWVGWKVVDDAKPLRRGQVILHLETPVLEFYEAKLWDRHGLEAFDEAMALVLLDYYAHSGAGPRRVAALTAPGPFDILRDRWTYMGELAFGFVSSDPVRLEYWTASLPGWAARMQGLAETVRRLGAAPPALAATITAPAVAPAEGERAMDSTQVAGIVRAVVAAVGGYFVGTGVIDQDTATQVAGAAAVIAAAVWSVIAKRKAPTA